MSDPFQSFIERSIERSKRNAEKWRPKFDLMPESVPCAIHPKVNRPKDWEATLEQSVTNAEFKPIFSDCYECIAEAKKARLARFWKRRGVPEKLIEATFKSFETPTPEHAEALTHASRCAKGKLTFLILIGDNGNGKSHLGAAALKASGDGLFIDHNSLLSDIRATYKAGGTDALIDSFIDAKLLVLDELGLATSGKDEQPILHKILSTRHDQGSPTIITSNKSLPEIMEILGFRLADRIAENYAVSVLRGESFRRKINQQNQ